MFLGKLMKQAAKAAKGVKSFARSKTGRALGGVLKKAAKAALPIVGGAVGNLVAPGVGGVIGSRIASGAGKMFGLELEAGEMEFEVAKKYVAFAKDATKKAVKTAGAAPAQAVVRAAVINAAKKQRILSPKQADAGRKTPYYGNARPQSRASRGGQWFRRGNRIVLVGV